MRNDYGKDFFLDADYDSSNIFVRSIIKIENGNRLVYSKCFMKYNRMYSSLLCCGSEFRWSWNSYIQ